VTRIATVERHVPNVVTCGPKVMPTSLELPHEVNVTLENSGIRVNYMEFTQPLILSKSAHQEICAFKIQRRARIAKHHDSLCCFQSNLRLRPQWLHIVVHNTRLVRHRRNYQGKSMFPSSAVVGEIHINRGAQFIWLDSPNRSGRVQPVCVC